MMKKIFLGACLFLCVMTLYAKAIREETSLAEKKARLGYSLGLLMGEDLEDIGLELDYDAFTEGLKASIEKEDAKISREEALELVESAMEAAMAKRAGENQAKEAQFLTENSSRSGIKTTPSGLQYEAITQGEGEKPDPADTVQVYYEGSLTNGTVFDSSMDEIAEFPLEAVIPGWSEGLRLMNPGSKYRLYIPSRLAYGERGVGQIIPPYSTLIFTVELLKIVKPGPDNPAENPGEAPAAETDSAPSSD
jgi:FKBP-type peptidyl-prolyl cis-trans isomerase FkpA